MLCVFVCVVMVMVASLMLVSRRFVFNALEPIQHTPQKTAPIFAHSGQRLLSTIEPGELGIPVLKHLHHVWPHYVVQPDGACGWHVMCALVDSLVGSFVCPARVLCVCRSPQSESDCTCAFVVAAESGSKQLYILVSGWSKGKFAVLKHEPKGQPSKMEGWDLSPGGKGLL